MGAKLKSNETFHAYILGKTSTTWLVAFRYFAVFPLWIFHLSLCTLNHIHTHDLHFHCWNSVEKKSQKNSIQQNVKTKRGGMRKIKSRRVSLNIVWFCLLPNMLVKRSSSNQSDDWFLIRFLWILLLFSLFIFFILWLLFNAVWGIIKKYLCSSS